MHLFKKILSSLAKASFALTMLFVMAACSLPTPQKSGIEDTASYYVTRNEGKFVRVENHPKISIPVSRTMSLSACVRDNNYSRNIISHKFIVRGGAKEQVLSTDADGCLVWEEDLAFSALADENYIEIKRELIPQGYQTGSREVTFIANPWAGKIFSNIDSKVKDVVPEAQAQMALMGSKQKEMQALWLDWVRFNITQEQISQNSGTYNVEVSANIFYERLDQSRERQIVPVTQADAVGRIQIICAINSSATGPSRVVLAQMDNVKASILPGGKVIFKDSFTLKEYCSTTGYFIASVSLAVPNGPELLAPFHGIFHGGPVRNLVGNTFSVVDGNFAERFKTDKSYSIESYLADHRTLYRNGTAPMKAFYPLAGTPDTYKKSAATPVSQASGMESQSGNGPANGNGDTPDFIQKFRIEIRPLIASNFGWPQQKLKSREVTFRLRACMVLGIDSQPIRAVTFNVHKVNGSMEAPTTNDDGCLEWEDSLKYNHFEREQWFAKTVRFTNKDYAFDQTLHLQINPWSQLPDWFRDIRWLSAKDRPLKVADSASQILMDYYFFDYSTNRYNYSIDQYLNLNHRRLANIAFRPSLYRRSFGDPRGYVSEPLPAGRYLLRYALVDQTVQDPQNLGALKERIYSVDRTILNVREDGGVADQISFWIQSESVFSLGLLNQFILELVPLKEGVTLASDLRGEALENFVDHETSILVLPHVASFQHRQGEMGAIRKLDRYTGQSLVLELEQIYKKEQAKNQQLMNRLARKEAFAQQNDLTLINLNNEEASKPFRSKLANATNSDNRGNTPAVTTAAIRYMMDTGKIDPALASRFCGYFLGTQWTEKLAGKDYGLINTTEGPAETARKISHLYATCRSRFAKAPAEAFDIEYDYFVDQPHLKATERCATSDNGQKQCAREIAPERVEIRSLIAGSVFTMSRGYGLSKGTGSRVGGSLGFFGISGGYSYDVGAAETTNETNTVALGQDIALAMETVRFKVTAPDAERCMMIRMNPTLFDQEDQSWTLLGFKFEKTAFGTHLHPKLTEEERFLARRKGLLICDGQKLNRPVEFTESYYLVRPNTPVGLIGDEKARAHVEGLFTSLRGVNDVTAFIAQISHAGKIPASFQREYQSRQLDTTKLREAIYRGTRASPGVFSSPRPL